MVPSGLGTPPSTGVGSWIERRARTAPEHVAIVAGDRAITYAEWAKRIRRLANGLLRLGVRHGDRVAWLGDNHVAFLETLFASGLVGAVLAPVNHRLEADAIRSILLDAEPAVVIDHLPATSELLPAGVSQRITVSGPSDGATDFETLVAESPDAPIDACVLLDDLCLLPHTSGTTGSPKGIMLTHANLTWNVVNFLSCADFRSDDVTPAIAPFFRVGGTGVNVLPVLFMGGTVVIPNDATPDEILRSMQRHRVTVGFGNPDSLDALTRSELWPAADLSSVRFVVTGGAPVPEHLIRTYVDRGVNLLQGYGLSEAGPLALMLDPESALEKIGSAGRPPLLVDVRIVRPDGAVANVGETGELQVRGPNVMRGYWRRPDATRSALSEDGWLGTGDAARADQDGFMWIVGRVADAIPTQSEIVYPGDVERVLIDHPAIADVGVIQAPGTGGDSLVAFVVLSDGANASEDDVVAFGRERLAPHEAPASVVFVEQLPRSSVGKLLRAELRAMASASDSP